MVRPLKLRCPVLRYIVSGAVFGVLVMSNCLSQITQRVSVSNQGAQGNGHSNAVGLTEDGRYVCIVSTAGNLVAGDTAGHTDVFVRDRRRGITERVSVNSNGQQGNADSAGGWISAHGSLVAFSSWASNLVASDTNSHSDVFVRDRVLANTELVSVSSTGNQGNGDSFASQITPDGRFVVFMSTSDNLDPGDTNQSFDVFVRDRQGGQTECVSVSSGGVRGNGQSTGGSISDDGRYVVFTSDASNLVPGDTNSDSDVFVRDRQAGTTERVSVATDGSQGVPAKFYDVEGRISSDGRFVAFISSAGNLVSGDNNGLSDVFVRDLQLRTTERVSLGSHGQEGNGDVGHPRISAGGRFVAFSSDSSNLVDGDTNGASDVFLVDRALGTIERTSLSSLGEQSNGPVGGGNVEMARGGAIISFDSPASNLVPGDTNNDWDVFVRDRFAEPAFSDLCSPGLSGVISCPCANAPGGLGRGCDNSAATGGASLSAMGGACLSSDSLVFLTEGETPTGLSVLWQGTLQVPSGQAYGQGVRCIGGMLRRLFTKNASGGSVSVPEFSAGDPTVSDRSAVMGDIIGAGESRWYLVSYRDRVVSGGCSSASTFNCTQTGRVDWSP